MTKSKIESLLSGLQNDEIEFVDLTDNAEFGFIRAFDEIMADFGRHLLLETIFLSKCEAYLARIYSFELIDGDWSVTDLQSGSPIFYAHKPGTVLTRLREVLTSKKTPSVSAIFFVPPDSFSGSAVQLALFCDNNGQCALGLGREKLNWLPVKPGPVLRLVEDLDRLGTENNKDFFLKAADSLANEITSKFIIAADSQESKLKHLISDWLPENMQQLANDATRLNCKLANKANLLFDSFAMEQSKTSKKELDDLIAAHKRQVKKLISDREKAELLAKGCQVRADSLSKQIAELKRKSIKMPDTANQPIGVDIGKALDSLF